MLTLSLNPTYLCNFRCDFCYLTKSQLSDKNKLSISKLEECLLQLKEQNVEVGHIDLYGGEIALLPIDYLQEMSEVLSTLGQIPINIITNLSSIPEFFLKDHIDLSVSFDFDVRQDHEKVLQNIISLDKEVAILMLASPALMTKNVDSMIDTFNSISNIRSVEIKPYSSNQANSLDMNFQAFENFVLKWLESTKEKKFEFINYKEILLAAKMKRNAFSNDHIYITPRGKFSVLEFDEDDHEFFLELDNFKEYQEWKEVEKKRVSENSFCSSCEYYGTCLTEHYREVKDLKKSCNGFYNLIKWGTTQQN